MLINNAFVSQNGNVVSSSYKTTKTRCLIELQRDSVLDGAYVEIQACSVNNPKKFTLIKRMKKRRFLALELDKDIFIRAKIVDSTDDTLINLNIIT